MGSTGRRLDEEAFERLCEHMAVAIVHCSDQQVLDLADSLHAALRRRRRNVLGRPHRLSDPADFRSESPFVVLDT